MTRLLHVGGRGRIWVEFIYSYVVLNVLAMCLSIRPEVPPDEMLRYGEYRSLHIPTYLLHSRVTGSGCWNSRECSNNGRNGNGHAVDR